MTRSLTRDSKFSKISRPVIDFIGLPVVLVSYLKKHDFTLKSIQVILRRKKFHFVITVAKEGASCSNNKMETLVSLF